MLGSEDLVLLEFWASPFSARVKIALKEKGITNYECRLENMHDKSSLLLEMNPVHKKIPVLIHDGKPVCESLIVLEYIDEIWKDTSPTLMPVDPYERAQARFWADFNDKMFSTFVTKLWQHKEGFEIIDEDEKKRFINFLKLLEAEVGDQPYFGGDLFGYLDIVLITDYTWFNVYETCTKLNIEDECPKLISWAHRCMERESVKMSLPNDIKIYEFVLDVKQRLGKDGEE